MLSRRYVLILMQTLEAFDELFAPCLTSIRLVSSPTTNWKGLLVIFPLRE